VCSPGLPLSHSLAFLSRSLTRRERYTGPAVDTLSFFLSLSLSPPRRSSRHPHTFPRGETEADTDTDTETERKSSRETERDRERLREVGLIPPPFCPPCARPLSVTLSPALPITPSRCTALVSQNVPISLSISLLFFLLRSVKQPLTERLCLPLPSLALSLALLQPPPLSLSLSLPLPACLPRARSLSQCFLAGSQAVTEREEERGQGREVERRMRERGRERGRVRGRLTWEERKRGREGGGGRGRAKALPPPPGTRPPPTIHLIPPSSLPLSLLVSLSTSPRRGR